MKLIELEKVVQETLGFPVKVLSATPEIIEIDIVNNDWCDNVLNSLFLLVGRIEIPEIVRICGLDWAEDGLDCWRSSILTYYNHRHLKVQRAIAASGLLNKESK